MLSMKGGRKFGKIKTGYAREMNSFLKHRNINMLELAKKRAAVPLFC
jgi:hypothetical protein